ncbi:MAG TPA: hypothetical protein VFI03_07385 [Solirubrobacterales bacterium]|nr:hypothetical protein [Solirubrobacterales bacterium]
MRIFLATLALAGLAAFPAGASAAALVPPGNSAANQYTETFPTTGGNAEAKGKGKVTAGDVLGAGNAEKLDSQGKQGREAAAVVAATAPPATAAAPTSGEGGGQDSSGATGGVSKGNGGSGGNGGQSGGGTAPAAGAGSGSGEGTVSADTSGSSGFSEVLGQATGSTTSGGTGLLLPLVLLASAIWAVAFFLRRKRRTA